MFDGQLLQKKIFQKLALNACILDEPYNKLDVAIIFFCALEIFHDIFDVYK